MWDPEKSSEMPGAKITWRWVSHKSKPWAQMWHAKYVIEREKKDLIRFSESWRGSQIWNLDQAGTNLVQDTVFGN